MRRTERPQPQSSGPEQIVPQMPEKPINAYYQMLARRFSALRYLCLAMLVLFVLLMFTAFGENITYENLRYLLKDIGSVKMTDSTGSFSSVSFDKQGNSAFAMFREELATVSSSGVCMYNAAGTKTLTYTTSYTSPAVAVSDKYLLVYEIGGTRFSLYNSFTEVYTGHTDYAILCGDVADNGAFVLVSRSREYRYIAEYYDKNFTLSARYSKEKYVIDAKIRPDGRELILLSADTADGEYVTELMVCAVNADTPKKTETLHGNFPVNIRYFADNGFVLICDDALYFYDRDGNRVGEYLCDSAYVVTADAGTDYLGVILREEQFTEENFVFVFDTTGNILYNSSVEAKIRLCAAAKETFFMLGAESVTTVQYRSGELSTQPIAVGAEQILPRGENRAVLCYDDRAVALQ